MEAGRYRTRARREAATMKVTRSTMPQLLGIICGISVTVVGCILFAAYGLPEDTSNHPKRLAGPIALGVGLFICLCAMLYALKVQREQKRAEKMASEQGQVWTVQQKEKQQRNIDNRAREHEQRRHQQFQDRQRSTPQSQRQVRNQKQHHIDKQSQDHNQIQSQHQRINIPQNQPPPPYGNGRH